MTESSPALRHGSVSLRLYPHLDLPAADIVSELLAQGRLGERAGFDGLMVSEHHNAFAGYLPNPIQAAGWLLEATDDMWAAACPMLLPLRPPALVAEELAWLAARFPGRVGLGVAAGSLEADFEIAGTTKDDLTARFASALAMVSRMLLGRDPGPLPDDPAIQRCAVAPIPVVSAANSAAAARRAADLGVGLLFDSLTAVSRCRELVEVYRDAGGDGPIALIRRVEPGTPDNDRQEQQRDLYRSYAPSAAPVHWAENALVSGEPDAMSEQLAAQAEAVGATCLNVRVHAPGMTPAEARSHISALGPVVDLLRRTWRPGETQ